MAEDIKATTVVPANEAEEDEADTVVALLWAELAKQPGYVRCFVIGELAAIWLATARPEHRAKLRELHNYTVDQLTELWIDKLKEVK